MQEHNVQASIATMPSRHQPWFLPEKEQATSVNEQRDCCKQKVHNMLSIVDVGQLNVPLVDVWQHSNLVHCNWQTNHTNNDNYVRAHMNGKQ